MVFLKHKRSISLVLLVITFFSIINFGIFESEVHAGTCDGDRYENSRGLIRPIAQITIRNSRTGESLKSPDGCEPSTSMSNPASEWTMDAKVGDRITVTNNSRNSVDTKNPILVDYQVQNSDNDFYNPGDHEEFYVYQSRGLTSVTLEKPGIYRFAIHARAAAKDGGPDVDSKNGNQNANWWFSAVYVRVAKPDPPIADFEIRYDGSDVTDRSATIDNNPVNFSLRSTSKGELAGADYEWSTGTSLNPSGYAGSGQSTSHSPSDASSTRFRWHVF